jgi:hypothetical protein
VVFIKPIGKLLRKLDGNPDQNNLDFYTKMILHDEKEKVDEMNQLEKELAAYFPTHTHDAVILKQRYDALMSLPGERVQLADMEKHQADCVKQRNEITKEQKKCMRELQMYMQSSTTTNDKQKLETLEAKLHRLIGNFLNEAEQSPKNSQLDGDDKVRGFLPSCSRLSCK